MSYRLAVAEHIFPVPLRVGIDRRIPRTDWTEGSPIFRGVALGTVRRTV